MFLRKLNPISKGIATIFYICLFSFFSNSWLVSLSIISIILLVSLLAKEDVLYLLYSLRKIWLLLVCVGIFQTFLGGRIDFTHGVNAVLRLSGVFIVATLYTKISTQSELLYFWELFFKPFSIFGTTSNELALMMVIAIRFLPVFISEIDRIKMAQTARGAKIEKGRLLEFINFMPLLIPILHQSIRRSEELADAMEARGYSPNKPRGRYKAYGITYIDYLLSGVSLCLLGFVVYFYFCR